MPPFSFSLSTQRSEPSQEEQWRKYTYRAYLGGLHGDDFEWSLRFVQTCRFANSLLPPDFAFFAGRVASLGIDRLGLPAEEVRHLLLSLADGGARLPGAAWKMRVARPWCALLERAVGDELVLPTHWLEGLELHGDPLSAWIGQRAIVQPICPALLGEDSEGVRLARKQLDDLDWSIYESTRFGWRLRDTPPLPPGFLD